MDIVIIFTCFNRKEKSIKCVKSLAEKNQGSNISFIIVDDNSSDGTSEAIANLGYKTILIKGDGNLFWSGGMQKGISTYFEKGLNADYILLVNDDVEFFDDIVAKLIERSKKNENAVVVGATCDDKTQFSYGALKLVVPRKNDLYYHIEPSADVIEYDTFNCNCVLLPVNIVKKIGNFDKTYSHSLADLDYGFRLSKNGYRILSSENYVGICNRNSTKGTWRDKTISRIERIQKKESIKGSPFKEWFYFMNKNFGLFAAIRYSITPYIRILLNK